MNRLERSEPSSIRAKPTRSGGASVRLEEISHRFPGRRVVHQVLEGINLQIRAGEFFCLIGPSGCGKTTVLDILAGFLHPARGSAYVDNRPIIGPGNDRVVVFQDVYNSLFPWMTVRDNVEFGLKMAGVGHLERRERSDAFLRLVSLVDHAAKYPDELSGGMKQRVQLARALAIQPNVLLMDEPFGALDAYTRQALQVELLRIWNETGTTVFFITHDILEAVLLSDRIGIMSAGPGATLMKVVEVPLPRPRTLADPSFGTFVGDVEGLQRSWIHPRGNE